MADSITFYVWQLIYLFISLTQTQNLGIIPSYYPFLTTQILFITKAVRDDFKNIL